MFGYRPFLLFPNLKSLQHSTQQLFSFFYIKMWIMNIYVFKNVIKRLALQAVKMGIFDLRLCSETVVDVSKCFCISGKRSGMNYSVTGAYHPHTMGRLWWCRPPARENRSTWRFGSAPRFCSCCSSGAAPPPHRCPSGRCALQAERHKGQVRDFHLQPHPKRTPPVLPSVLHTWFISLWYSSAVGKITPESW